MKQTKERNTTSITSMTTIALMTAVTCILGPLSVPIGPVPISFTNLAIYLSVIILGWKKGTLSYLLYLLLGLFGLPVFSGFTSGPMKLFGVTGGYLVGFLFLALISGLFVEKFENKKVMYAVGMGIGSLVNYIFGTGWLSYQAGMGFREALAIGVLPFVAGDALKIVIAVVIGPMIKKKIRKAGVL